MKTEVIEAEFKKWWSEQGCWRDEIRRAAARRAWTAALTACEQATAPTYICRCGAKLNLLKGKDRKGHFHNEPRRKDKGQAVYVCTSSCGGGVQVMPSEGS